MKTIAFLSALMLLAACNGGGGGGSSSSSSASQDYFGLWRVCENYDSGSDQVDDSSVLTVLTIADGSTSVSKVNYNVINCVNGNEEYKYQYFFSSSQTGSTIQTTLLFDTATSLAASDVTFNNNTNYCGFNNWVLNVPKVVTGRNCQGEITNVGDQSTLSLNRVGNNLTIGDLTYSLDLSPELSPSAISIPNQNFSATDGESLAIYLSISNGNYQLYRYDLVQKRYNVESGSYSPGSFTITSSTPVGCHSGVKSRPYELGDVGLGINFEEENTIVFLERAYESEANFRNGTLQGGFTTACF